jgi:hypothetical protein
LRAFLSPLETRTDMDARSSDLAGTDFSELDDPAFLAERRRVRTLLEDTSECDVTPELAQRLRELDEEFLRRARLAWQDAS